MGFGVPSVEVMTWKLPLGFIALTRGVGRLNVLEPVRGLKEKNMGMIVNIAAVSESPEGLFDAVYQWCDIRRRLKRTYNGY